MKKGLWASVLVLGLGACASPDGLTPQQRLEAGRQSPHAIDRIRVGPGDWGDTASTAAGLWRFGLVEGNPILAPLGDAVPVVLPFVKYGMKHLAVQLGATPRQANISVESAGAGATCWNLSIIGGATMGLAAGLGIGCWLVYRHNIERWEGAHVPPEGMSSDRAMSPVPVHSVWTAP